MIYGNNYANSFIIVYCTMCGKSTGEFQFVILIFFILLFLFLLAGSDHPPPIIKQGPINQTVPVDSTVVLGCQTAGAPPPTVHWKKDGAVVSPVDSRMSLTETGSLKIHYAKVRDEVI